MSQIKSVEATGDSVEEAIALGLAELGVNPTEVVVEVLEEPSKGVFGLGARPAKVRLQLLSVPKPPPAPTPTPAPVMPPVEQPEPAAPPARPPADDYKVSDEDDGVLYEADEVAEADLDEEAQIAKVVLGEILEKMDIRGRIVIRKARQDDPGETAPWVLDVTGSNLTRLIGRRGETLASLQYITRLITSRELQRRSEVVVDIGGYKARRAQSLHALALRMADEALERGNTVTLEPMPPHERRIIHLALRAREDVVTRSIGEGQARKVTIMPSDQA